MKLKPIVETIMKEAGLDTGQRTLGGSHLDRDQTVYSYETIDDAVNVLKDKLKAPVVQVKYSALGGPRNATIMISLSLDPKESWSNGIYQNSRYMQFRVEQDGVIEQFSKSYKVPLKFRKQRAKDLNDVVAKMNAYLSKAE